MPPLIALLLILGVFTLEPRQSAADRRRDHRFGWAPWWRGMVVFMEYRGTGWSRRPHQSSSPRHDPAGHFRRGLLHCPHPPRMAQQRWSCAKPWPCCRKVAIRDDMTGLVSRRHMLQLLGLQRERQARTGRGLLLA